MISSSSFRFEHHRCICTLPQICLHRKPLPLFYLHISIVKTFATSVHQKVTIFEYLIKRICHVQKRSIEYFLDIWLIFCYRRESLRMFKNELYKYFVECHHYTKFFFLCIYKNFKLEMYNLLAMNSTVSCTLTMISSSSYSDKHREAVLHVVRQFPAKSYQ